MPAMRLPLAGLLVAPFVLSCATPEPWAADTADPHAGLDLPGHNECLPSGEQMNEEICLAVVEEDGRVPTKSERKSNLPEDVDDPRLDDPEIAWLQAEAKRCTCSCCHTGSFGGPGVYFWDLDFEPVWLDSASIWSLEVFAGLKYSEIQQFPTEEPQRVEAIIRREISARQAEWEDVQEYP